MNHEPCSEDDEKMLDPAGVAELLAVPRSWVYEKVSHGDIPHYRVGKYIRFRTSEIREWLKSLNGHSSKKATPFTTRESTSSAPVKRDGEAALDGGTAGDNPVNG